MTEPLTPPESDLQDFPFMPLHVARLRDSDLAAEAAPEACWYAVLLWAASWHQLPAGSLPDNDAVLTKLIGLGRDVRTFSKHKAAAMRGFILCSDGRLYHPIVAEQVRAAWESKLQQRWRTECARIKKQNQRNGTNLAAPTYEQFIAAMSAGQPAPSPDIVPGDITESPSGQLIQETGTGKGKVEEPPVVPKGTNPPSIVLRKSDIEAVWAATPNIARQRTSKADIERALQGAARRGHPPADVLAGVVAYFASPAATKDGGEFAKGTHRIIERDRWQSFVDTGTPLEALAAAPDPNATWRNRVRAYFHGSRFWNSTDWEAPPGRPGCIVPPAVLAEFAAEMSQGVAA